MMNHHSFRRLQQRYSLQRGSTVSSSLLFRTTTAFRTVSNKNSNNNDDDSHLPWKDRKQAPKWMQRIAPTKGGRWPPSPQEGAILAVGLAVFVGSWTVGS